MRSAIVGDHPLDLTIWGRDGLNGANPVAVENRAGDVYRWRVATHRDAYPAGFGGEMAMASWGRTTKILDQKVMHANIFRVPLRHYSRPLFLTSPTGFFCFVSTKIAG